MRFDLIETGARGNMQIILMIERGPKSMEHNMKRTVRMALVLGVISALGLSACETGPAEEETVAELVWPAAPGQPRVKYLKSWSDNAFTLGDKQVMKALLGEQDDIFTLRKPYGVHVDKSGRVFVTDTEWDRVIVFDEKNKSFAFWGEKGEGALINPIGVSSDDEGRIYVTDSAQKKVVVFDSEGGFVRSMGDDGGLVSPTGIAVSNKLEKVFVVDTKGHLIAVFDLDGNRVGSIGKRGSGPGEFNFPTNISVDGDGRLYVTDPLNFRVQILESDGTFVGEFGKGGIGFGNFSRPKGVAVDSDGNIHVVDAAFNNFQIFNQGGELLLFVGEAGNKEGQFVLPAGAYIDGEDHLYVVDQLNHRVQVFQILTEGHAAKSGS